MREGIQEGERMNEWMIGTHLGDPTVREVEIRLRVRGRGEIFQRI
jgi:hypothetical protein